jgi:hypothetical protein
MLSVVSCQLSVIKVYLELLGVLNLAYAGLRFQVSRCRYIIRAVVQNRTIAKRNKIKKHRQVL